MAETVLVTRAPAPSGGAPSGGGREIATLTLNRPEVRNALLPSMVRAFRLALEKLVRDPAVRCVVITGAGAGDRAAFCAGADLRNALVEEPNLIDELDRYLDDFHGCIRLVWNSPKPILARIDGPAAGFGCDLALACDLRVFSTAGYLQSSFARIGLVPDGGGTGTLSRMVGLGVAAQLIYLAEKVDAHRALSLGLATKVVSPEALDEAVATLAGQLAAAAPLAFMHAKRAMHAALGVSIDDILAEERIGQLVCLRSADALEGVMAWAEKRPADFKGI